MELEQGRLAGASHRTLSTPELGKYVDPRVSFAIHLARALERAVEGPLRSWKHTPGDGSVEKTRA